MITEAPIEANEVTFPELTEVDNQAALVLVEFNEIVKIENEDQYRKMSRMVLDAAANIKLIEAHTEERKKAAYGEWERICEVIRRKCAPWKQIKTSGSPMLAAYQHEQEQERIRREDEERARLQKEAEVQQAEQAEQLANEGRLEDAVALLDSTPVASPVVASKTIPTIQGIGGAKTVYSVRVKDVMALVKAIAGGAAPVQAIEVNQSFLNKQASLYRDSFTMAGCELLKEQKLSSVRSR